MHAITDPAASKLTHLGALRARADYAADGVAVVRGAVGADWIATLLAQALEEIAAALRRSEDTGFPPDMKNLWQHRADFRRFVHEAGLAALAASVVGSREMRIVLDQIWTKASRSRQRTRWHYDGAAWPVTGDQLPSIWLALTPIAAENCLSFVAGSHLLPCDPQATAFVDFWEPDRAAGARFLAWDLELGDALIFHPLAYHACDGNSAGHRRVAFTTRWAGDDIRYDPTRGYIDEGLSFADCVDGQPLRGPDFPRVAI